MPDFLVPDGYFRIALLSRLISSSVHGFPEEPDCDAPEALASAPAVAGVALAGGPDAGGGAGGAASWAAFSFSRSTCAGGESRPNSEQKKHFGSIGSSSGIRTSLAKSRSICERVASSTGAWPTKLSTIAASALRRSVERRLECAEGLSHLPTAKPCTNLQRISTSSSLNV